MYLVFNHSIDFCNFNINTFIPETQHGILMTVR